MRFSTLLLLSFALSSDKMHAQQTGWTCQDTLGELSGVSFIDDTHGIAVGTGGMILHTTNGGTTWNQRNSMTVHSLHDVQMVSATVAYAVGSQGTILKSIDGGIIWTPIPSPQPSGAIGACAFLNPTTGILVGATGLAGFIARTSDGGATWWTGDANVLLFDVSLLPNGDGLMVGSFGYLWKTRNSGLSWDLIATLPGFAHSVTLISSSVAIAVGSGVFRTRNGGITWEVAVSNLPGQLYEVQFVNSQNGVAVGQDGLILRTGDGGMTWQQQESGTLNNLRGVSFSDPLTGTVVGGGIVGECTILRTTTGGFPTDVDDENSIELSRTFTLEQNYPNPFNPITMIRFQIARQEMNHGGSSTTSSWVTLKVYDVLGREAMTLVEGNMEAGAHSVQMDGSGLASGIYFYTLRAGGFVATRKLLLLN